MAITIKLQPKEIQSAYNEVITVLDSTNKSEPKFQYIIEIYIDGVYSSRLKVQSNPQGFGVVNLQKHLESYLTSSFDISSKEIFKKIKESYIEYSVVLSEEYVLTTNFTSVSDNGGFCQYNYATPHNFINGDFVTVSNSTTGTYDGNQEITNVHSSLTSIVTGKIFAGTATGDTILSNNTVTVIPDAAVFTSNRYALNNVLNWLDVPNWDATDFDIDSAAIGSVFTNLPKTMTTRLDDRITFNFYNNHAANEAGFLKVVSDRGTYYFDNPFPIASDDTRFLSIGVGAFDILNGSLAGGIQSTLPVIDASTKSYTIELTDTSRVVSSEKYTFNVDQKCYNFEGTRLMYLNKGGSFSVFNFPLESKKTVSVKKTNYQQNYGAYDSVGISYGWESSDRGTVRLDTDIRESYSIQSDLLNESEGNLIEDLLISPEVYHLADNSYTYGAELTITSIVADGLYHKITTSAAHGLALGDVVLLNDITIPAYNGEHSVIAVASTTEITIDLLLGAQLPFSTGTVSQKVFSSDGVLRGVDILTNSVKIKKRRADGLINYSLNFKYSNKNTVQR